MDLPNLDSPTGTWLHRTCSFAHSEEEVNLRMSTPQMQSVRHALELLTQVVRDRDWIDAHDPDGKLDEALRALLHVTRVRKPHGP